MALFFLAQGQGLLDFQDGFGNPIQNGDTVLWTGLDDYAVVWIDVSLNDSVARDVMVRRTELQTLLGTTNSIAWGVHYIED